MRQSSDGRLRQKEIAGYGPLKSFCFHQEIAGHGPPMMAYIDKRRLQVVDLFRLLKNERPTELCLIYQNSEEVHNLQSPDKKKYWCYYPHRSRDLVSPYMRDFST